MEKLFTKLVKRFSDFYSGARILKLHQGTAFSAAISIESAQSAEASNPPPHWLQALQTMLSPSHVRSDFETRVEHSRDRLPFGRFRHRSKQLTGTLPSAVVEPKSSDEIQQVVRFAIEHKLSVIPYGSGSGVLGGTVPFNGELIIATNRMNKILDIDESNFVVRMEAGTNGRVLETTLRDAGFTCGHYPQSMDLSTVGGWAACRGSGQSSSRYGNIENMIVGMKVVLPSGELLEVRHVPRRSVGPNLIELFIGSEGTLGLIVELTMKIWGLPEHEIEGVVAFPGIEEGLNAIRDVMQAELKPSLARLYDQGESERWGQDDLPVGSNSVICMFEFIGRRAVAES